MISTIGKERGRTAVDGSVKYSIDIVGTCNLKCPSCGRRDGYEHTPKFKGIMSYDLILKILDKIRTESPGKRHIIGLYDWGEPLMHPKIGDIITAIRDRGMDAMVSTNGNATKFLEDCIRAKPLMFGVSLSGFTKDTYEITHKGGDASTVIGTIIRAHDLIDRYDTGTQLIVNFHLYKNNAGDLALLKRLVKTLDCDYTISLGRLITLDDYRDSINGKPNPIVDNLLVTPKQFLEISKKYKAPCGQIEEKRISINPDGSVQICCAVMGDQYKMYPSYLDVTKEQFFAKRDVSPICTGCMSLGYHSDWAHLPIFRDMVNEALRKNGGSKYVKIIDTRLRGTHNALKGLIFRHYKRAAMRRVRRWMA